MASRRDVKVGAFVLAGLTVAGSVIFLIGDERGLFQTKVEYSTEFEDVQGLVRGSPVRMGGVTVGTVARVDYGTDVSDKNIHVRLSVGEGNARRIRKDSVATIEGKGLLGDKMIVVTVGTAGSAELPNGSHIPSKAADDLGKVMTRFSTISGQVEKVVGNLQRATESLADDKFRGDVRASMASLAGILASVDHGEGYVGKLLTDPAESARVSHLVQNLERTSGELAKLSANLNEVLTRVNEGPGFAHELVYGEDGSKTLSKFGNVADELTTTLRSVREGNGLARSVIYGDDSSQQVLSNLNQASVDFRQIMSDMRAGKGTLGALLVDPSVYEDVKLMLGNVERNRALRALVRYSIKRDEKSPAVEVRDPNPVKTEAEALGAGRAGAKVEKVEGAGP